MTLPGLPNLVRVSGIRWRCAAAFDASLLPAATAGMDRPDSLPATAWLKRSERRRVFRIGEGATAVVKGNRMRGWKDGLLHHPRWSAREARNLTEAAARGLPVPRLLAFGRRRRGLRVRWTALVMEDLAPRETLEASLRAAASSAARQEALLERAGHLLLRLHRAGFLHVDPSGQSFLIGESTPGNEADDRIIDLQYCGRPEAADGTTLAFQAGYLADTVAPFVPAELLSRWGAALIDEGAGIGGDAAARLFASWRGRDLSRRERLSLGRR